MKESEKYATFWKEFGRTIKLGVIEDAPNRPRLAKLLRVHTSAVMALLLRQHSVSSSNPAVHHGAPLWQAMLGHARTC